jgi:hypothetical protein
MRRVSTWIALGLALSSAPAAGADEAALQLWDERYLTLRAGATAQMTLRASVGEGYAVIARAGPGGKFLPLSLKLEAGGPLGLSKPVYPESEAGAGIVAGAPASLRVYRGTILIRFSVTAPRRVDPGPHEIKGLLSYQACDARRCLPAMARPVELIVTIRDKPPEL